MWEEEFMFVSNLCLLIAVQWARGRSHLPWWHKNIFEQEKTEQVIMFLPSHPWLNLVMEIMCERKCEKNKERKQNGQTPAHEANEGKLNDRFGIIVSDRETKMNLSVKQRERL
ncbi:hypothetical protein EDB84DRAFT_1438911 [Lactarius hengduanensis]|nr:hypothetical protein EDB84DRAFT_1438911 [Lactarius hengduanensis]